MIRVAILGAGIGREHLWAYRELADQFTVAKIIDQNTDRAESLRDKGERFIVSANLSDAMDSPDIDLIDICLPPHLHQPTACDALSAGKHVICEKPLATSLSDCALIESAQAESGKRIFPVFQYRFGPSCAQLRALIAAGLTGKPQVAALETHWNRGADYYAVPWRGTWDREQGGAVLGHAIHNHDLLTHFMGAVQSVSATVATRINPIETEDCAAISFELENGVLATSSITLGAATDESRLRFVFESLTATSGTAPYAPGQDVWKFTARDPAYQTKVDQVVANTLPEPNGFTGFLAAVAKDISTGTNDAVDLADGINSIALVTAIYKSARSGAKVKIPLPANDPIYQGWLP